MKKSLLAIVMAVVILALSAGCNVGGGTAKRDAFEVPAEGFDTSKQISIQFYNTMGQSLTPVLDAYIIKFNELYPNIEVKYTSVGGYDDVRDQIKNEITVGGQPNLAYCYPDHIASYNLANAVTVIDNLIDSKIEVERADETTETIGLTSAQKADFIQGYYEEGRQFGDGQMYSMPFSKSTEVLYYNKTVFDKHGLQAPDHWWCDDSCPADCKTSMEYVCRILKTEYPNSTPLGYDSESNWFITMCEQLGTPYTSATGKHFLFDTKENRAFVKRFNTWYKNGWLTTQELYGAYTSGLFINQKDDKVSFMSIGSSAGATHQRPEKVEVTDDQGVVTTKRPFEVGIVPIPQADKTNKKVISQGPSVCIFNKDDPQEVIASWLFVKYLTTSVDFQAEFAAASGYVPVIKSVAEHPVYAANMAAADGLENIAYLSAKVCLEQESYYFTSPAFNGSSTARDQVGILMKDCISLVDGDIDAQLATSFKNAIDECEYSAR